MILNSSEILKKCILVVEDNPADLELLDATLSAEFNVEKAMDGEEGLHKAIEVKPDLIISDVRMPHMSGFTLLKKVRSNPDLDSIPVILLTALDEPVDKMHGYELLADLYLTKPIDTVELFAASKSLIRLHQNRGLASPDSVVLGKGISDEDSQFLRKLVDSIHRNLEKFDFSVDDLAIDTHVTRRQLERRLKKLEFLSPAEYIRQVRLEQAKKLIESGLPSSISDLAHRVGFQDARHFSKIFKSFYGISPMLHK